MLPGNLTQEALDAAAGEDEPSSLAAAGRMRTRFGPELAARAIDQVVLRRRARLKFGDGSAAMFFTRDGLEQATRPAVADHHADRLVAAGAASVLDLGCGIGSDALAFARAGCGWWRSSGIPSPPRSRRPTSPTRVPMRR